MIGLTKLNIAVDPMFDHDVTDAHNAFSKEEIAYLEANNIPHDQANSLKIPETAIKKCDQGIVKYVGSEVEEKYDIHIGDWVLFSGYTGTTLRLEGEGLLIVMAATHVIAKVLPPDTDIPGLYFFDGAQYWTATHEMAIDLITRTFEEAGLLKTRPVKS